MSLEYMKNQQQILVITVILNKQKLKWLLVQKLLVELIKDKYSLSNLNQYHFNPVLLQCRVSIQSLDEQLEKKFKTMG